MCIEYSRCLELTRRRKAIAMPRIDEFCKQLVRGLASFASSISSMFAVAIVILIVILLIKFMIMINRITIFIAALVFLAFLVSEAEPGFFRGLRAICTFIPAHTKERDLRIARVAPMTAQDGPRWPQGSPKLSHARAFRMAEIIIGG